MSGAGGSVLYAMCTGRPPFRAESTIAVIRRVCDDRPRPIAEINADIPAWLAAIIDRLLEKRPEDRFQSAAEVADVLGRCLAHVQQPGLVPFPELPRLSRSADSSGEEGAENPIINKFVEISGSVNGNSGIVGVNQGSGNMGNQANVVSFAVIVAGAESNGNGASTPAGL